LQTLEKQLNQGSGGRIPHLVRDDVTETKPERKSWYQNKKISAI